MANGKTIKTPQNAALAADREYEKITLSLQRTAHYMRKSSADLKITIWMAIIGFSAYVIVAIVCLYFLIAAYLQYWH